MIGIRARLRYRALHLSPPMLLATFYLFFVVLGGFVLWLPWSNNVPLSFMEALFTSTSAVTVTGLVVVDTGATFTMFGQGVLMVLMQLGGLGLMTFAVFVLSAIGVSVGLNQRLILREDLNQSSIGDLLTLVRIIFFVAVGCEIAGAVLLAFVFVPELGWGRGLWFSAFHAVSAFNNAGFGLKSSSLMDYVGDPIVNLVIPTLFILGGLGFMVLGDLYTRRKWRSLTLHSKLMLAGTAGLIVWAFVTFAALEWTNPGTLGGLETTGERLMAAWFQSVTPRTAGFNTLDYSSMHDTTILMTIALMIIGGGSTSTAGGIKVTTFIVLILATIAFFRRRPSLNAFGRSLGVNEVMKVMALMTVSTLIIFVGLFVVSVSHDGDFKRLLFEVVSAFGTVGLSMGETANLDFGGRIAIMAVMFLGRVGPLTLGFFLARHSVAKVRYPAGQVFLG
ncbi:TrkH family potassium uptake protein [Litorisediminicola beolgyonensis]|uniref:TrkH family potassium uptake protein n=1 Tax=Litorisediminicola beolgyonensis TaxID=1173614 RepID=A0ABW3ZI61_9RHOB